MPVEKQALPHCLDVIVIGAGHAGCEAAMTCARLGLSTLLITVNIDRIGHLSCNPAIGGLAKGHLVKEIDALGGKMGLWADEAAIQFRLLNTSKGPAVQSSRAQIDRQEYMRVVQRDIFAQENLWVWQDIAETLLTENGRISGVKTRLGRTFNARTVCITAGTFMRGLIHVGLTNFSGGRLGDPAAMGLSQSLLDLGMELGRLKTGTTPRLLKSSINFDAMTPQYGDNPPRPFSFRTKNVPLPQCPCYLTWTNPDTHAAIRKGFDRSPMFTGVITGTGARYCPSIEDKVARFPEKDRHQIFVEPEGYESPEMYPSGIPTSLPLDIQQDMIASIKGLENAQIVRPGYAIEYDYANPTQLHPTLESKLVPGLWMAGQVNGTSGYEEAAGQGMWAALNISASLRGHEPFIPGRDQAYLAVMVDDLVTKGTSEPYRMFTSRAEHRLLLRENNADTRLTAWGREIGLVDDEHWSLFQNKTHNVQSLIEELEQKHIRPDAATCAIFDSMGEPAPNKGICLADLLRRPHLHIADLAPFRENAQEYSPSVCEEAETIIKYSGYLKRQEELVVRFSKQESISLPQDLDYKDVYGLTTEAVEKLNKVKPLTLGQASRISGLTPANMACIEIHLKKLGKA